MVYCFLAFYLMHQPGSQRLILSYMNLFMILYVGNAPLTSRFMNRLEMLNEAVVCYCTLLLALFTDWVPEPRTRELFGWQMIVVI